MAVCHAHLNNLPSNNFSDICVDSGQCGIFDYAYFQQIKSATDEEKENWFDRICDFTCCSVPNPKYKTEEEFVILECGVSEQDYQNSIDQALRDKMEYCRSVYSRPYIYKFSGNVIDGAGFVSSSGVGNGVYTCYYGTNSKGQITSIEVRFLEE